MSSLGSLCHFAGVDGDQNGGLDDDSESLGRTKSGTLPVQGSGKEKRKPFFKKVKEHVVPVAWLQMKPEKQ